MGAMLLRAERCLNCGTPMPADRRIDRRYCKQSCRTLAYRIRRRTQQPSRQRERAPQWVKGQPPVIGSALAALADLQARVLWLAHQLEQDDIDFRRGSVSAPVLSAREVVPTDATAKKTADADAARQIAELTAELQEARAGWESARAQATQAERRIVQILDENERLGTVAAQVHEMQEALGTTQTRLRETQQIGATAERQLSDSEADLEQARRSLRIATEWAAKLEADEASARHAHAQTLKQLSSSEAELEQTRRSLRIATERASKLEADEASARHSHSQTLKQLSELTAAQARTQRDAQAHEMRSSRLLDEQAQALAAERETGAKLKRRIGKLEAEQADWAVTVQTLSAQSFEARQRAEQLEAELVRYQTVDADLTHSQAHVKELQRQVATAEQTLKILQLQVAKQTAPPPPVDPLLEVMKEQVKLVHFINVQRAAAGLPLNGVQLRNFTDDEVLKTAIRWARDARQKFALRPSSMGSLPTWTRDNQELDPISENQLLQQQKKDLRAMREELGWLQKEKRRR